GRSCAARRTQGRRRGDGGRGRMARVAREPPRYRSGGRRGGEVSRDVPQVWSEALRVPRRVNGWNGYQRWVGCERRVIRSLVRGPNDDAIPARVVRAHAPVGRPLEGKLRVGEPRGDSVDVLARRDEDLEVAQARGALGRRWRAARLPRVHADVVVISSR